MCLLSLQDQGIRANSESDLLSRIRNGDEDAFEYLFREYYMPLLQFAIRYLNDKEFSEDVVQTVFLNIWRTHTRFEPKHTLRTYLYAAVKNQCLKKIRRLKIEKTYLIQETFLKSTDITPETQFLKNEFEAKIHSAIQKLPEKCRIIFCMNRFDGLTYKEIAVVQKVSISTVETQMVRALKNLRLTLKFIK